MNAGFSSRNITPDYQTGMAGFDRRTNPSSGTLDPLEVSVLILQDDSGFPFVFCVFDLLGVDSILCTRVQEAIGNRLRIAAAQIWVSATHSHSAPNIHFSGRKTYQESYVDFLLQKALEAAEEAYRSLEPVTAEIAVTAVTGVASLRNCGRSGAQFSMPLLVTCLKGQRKTCWLTEISCHPTVLDEKNTLFSRDLPGQLRDCLDSPCGLVLNGACADLSTRFTRTASDAAELKRLGTILGKAVTDAPRVCETAFGRRITAAEKTITLSRTASISGAERDSLLEQLKQRAASCTDVQALREYDSRISVLERAAVAAEAERKIRIGAVDLGNYVLLALPFEVGYADGQSLEKTTREAAGKPVYLVCYTGGYDGYLPSGAPLTADSSYEDFASRYLPESRAQVWECAKNCVKEAENHV